MKNLLALVLVVGLSIPLFAQCEPFAPKIVVQIDAVDLPRKLLHAEITYQLAPSSEAKKVALWYPKWIPGSHGPGGPIANVAGLSFKDQAGTELEWERTGGEVYRVEVQVPANTTTLKAWIRYIANQPTDNSMGHDCFGSSKVGVISPNTVVLYPEGANIDTFLVETELKLPDQWQVATALPRTESKSPNVAKYSEVNLHRWVDSPIMCGRFHQTYELVDTKANPSIPMHRLQLFADSVDQLEVHPELLERIKSMVVQAGKLTGSYPFDQFDILLALTDTLPANGLEHSRSTFNVLSPFAFASPATLRGWNRLLIPHEYMHSWCGKYRLPQGMMSSDFHKPKDTELLWVYEGLTQYMGELVEARSGWMTAKELRERIVVELRNAKHQQGRKWRTLADTGAASHLLRSPSDSWPSLRRSQDYYMEGMLFWLEVDALLRRKTEGAKSVDDFCQAFFQYDANMPHPNPYSREDLVRILNTLYAHDWDGLIKRRIESTQNEYDSDVASLLGYQLVLSAEPMAVSSTTFRYPRGIDLYDSLGASFRSNGTIENVLLGSPIDQARLAAGTVITAVGEHTWSEERLLEAVKGSKNGKPVELVYVDGDEIKRVQVHYYDGMRGWTLERDESQTDLIDVITTARN